MNITCKYRKKLNLGLTTGPVDHVVVPPIDGFHADAVLAQRDDHHSLGEIPSGPRAIVPEPHTNILRPRLALLERASHGEERGQQLAAEQKKWIAREGSPRVPGVDAVGGEAVVPCRDDGYPVLGMGHQSARKFWKLLMGCMLPAVIRNLYYTSTSSSSA